MPMLFLSPSTQEYNMYYDGSGSEEYYMNLIADAMVPYLRSNAIQYNRNTPNMTAASSIRASNAGNYDLHLALHSNAAPESLAGQLRGPDIYYDARSWRGRRLADIIANIIKVKMFFLGFYLRVEDDLHKQIPKFFSQYFGTVPVNSLADFVTFLDKIGAYAFMRLNLIPWTSFLRAQNFHYRQKIIYIVSAFKFKIQHYSTSLIIFLLLLF